MAVYCTWGIEIQFAGTAGAWTDVTHDVVTADTVSVEYGINDNGPTNRVATTGKLSFTLDNSENNSYSLPGLYSPGYASCRSGFTAGAPVRIWFQYDGIKRYRFYGRIAKDGIKPSPGIYGSRRTEVTVLDWMNQAGTHELDLPTYTTNKRIDEVVPLIVANMPLAPLATDYHTGQDTFVSIFDSVGAKTRALSEFQKLALSEYGYIYVKHGKAGQEVLVVEDRNAKITNNTLSQFTAPVGYLQKDDGGYLLTDDGFKIVLEMGEIDASFSNTGIDPEISLGKHFANQVTCTTYPRKYDTAATVLFDQPSYYTISAGATITGYKCNYRDPLGGAWHVAGKEMISPAATTDYLMNSDSNGSATDLTANLAVTAAYGANAVEYTLVNSATVTGYITKLQARGKGIYLYDPIDYTVDDTASKTDTGSQTLSIEMSYQDQALISRTIAAGELNNLKTMRKELDKWSFYANRDSTHMMAFLDIDIGDRVHFVETQTALDEDRFIDAIEFEITDGNVIKAGWKTRAPMTYGVWMVGITGATELGVTTKLG